MTMSSFSEEELDHLTKLCRIACTDEERKKLRKNLSQILSYIETLNELDTENAASYRSILETETCPLREDVVEKTLTKEEFLANAPAHTGGMIRVPPILKQTP